MPETRAAESKKRAARRVVARQWEKDKKLTEERAKEAEILQSVHARATDDALAKQAALYTVAMLKGEVVNQYTADHLGSTANSVSSVVAGWLHPTLPALSSMHQPPPQPALPSRLGVPMSPTPEMQFMAGGGMFQPIIDLNRTPIAGETSSWHSKAP
jgi:hypothetical protein